MLKICLILAVVAGTVSGQCESGWSSYGQSCYRLLTPAQSFDFHRDSCEHLGGRLVSIVSAGESNFVNQLQQSDCLSGQCQAFIGLRRNSAGQFTNWLDGNSFGAGFYSNWNSGEPNNVGGVESCDELIQSTGKWNDLSCSSNRLGMCEKAQPSRCGTGWTLFGECCYRLLTEVKTFDYHRSDCLNSGGDLVSISSAAENNFVQQVPQTGCGSCRATFIGLRRDGAGQFTSWLDGTPFGGSAYSNWNSNEPNNAGGSEDSGELIPGNGKWNDISCNVDRIAVCLPACNHDHDYNNDHDNHAYYHTNIHNHDSTHHYTGAHNDAQHNRVPSRTHHNRRRIKLVRKWMVAFWPVLLSRFN